MLPANLRFEHFPIVDAVLARLARVTDDDAAFQFVEIDAQLDAGLTSRRELDRRSTAKRRRVVILGAGGNVDDNGLCVATDVDPIDFALPCSGISVQGRTDRHRHGARAADARPVGSLRIRCEREATLRLEKLYDF